MPNFFFVDTHGGVCFEMVVLQTRMRTVCPRKSRCNVQFTSFEDGLSEEEQEDVVDTDGGHSDNCEKKPHSPLFVHKTSPLQDSPRSGIPTHFPVCTVPGQASYISGSLMCSTCSTVLGMCIASGLIPDPGCPPSFGSSVYENLVLLVNLTVALTQGASPGRSVLNFSTWSCASLLMSSHSGWWPLANRRCNR